ncbi:MAG TPA: hypothetical protein VM491_24630 [Burkholderiaceae bacterium]|nr:hypothetical protein [Burkholderiaceae bacterium]
MRPVSYRTTPITSSFACAALAVAAAFVIAPVPASANGWKDLPTDQRVTRTPLGEQREAARLQALQSKIDDSSGASQHASAPLPDDQRVSLTGNEARQHAMRTAQLDREAAVRAGADRPIATLSFGPLPTDQRMF